MKLWIIGNGFDLYHGLKTSYADYKAFLCWSHACDFEKEWRLGHSWKQDLRWIVSRDCDKCSIHAKCPVWKFNELPRAKPKGDLWSDLEEACALDPYGLMDRPIGFVGGGDRGGLEGNAANALLHGDLDFAKPFTGYKFYEWLRKVDASLPEKGKHLGIEEEDRFLTFNYTNTLHKTYKIPNWNILHVHGQLDDVEKALGKIDELYRSISMNGIVHSCLLFGSAKELTDSEINIAVEHYLETLEESKRSELREGLRNLLRTQMKSLTKDIKGRLSVMKNWVAKNCTGKSSPEEVVVAGHSLGRPDSHYFDYLAKEFNDRKWRFIYYREDDRRKSEEFCEQRGLHGYYMPWRTAEFEHLQHLADSDVLRSDDDGNCAKPSRASGTLAPTP